MSTVGGMGVVSPKLLVYCMIEQMSIYIHIDGTTFCFQPWKKGFTNMEGG